MNKQHLLASLFPPLVAEPGSPDHAYSSHATAFRYRDAAGLARGYVVAGVAPTDPHIVEIFHVGALAPERGDRAYMLDALCRHADEAGVRLRLMGPVLRHLNEVEDKYGVVGAPPVTLRDSVHKLAFDLRVDNIRPIGAGTLRSVGPSTTVGDFSGAHEAALLLAAWPGGPKAAAQAIGIPHARLAAYLAEREVLDAASLGAFRRVMALGFSVSADIGVVAELQGAYALHGDVPRAKLVSLYDELSHGGDLLLAGEVVPCSGPEDSARRFLVLQAYGGEPCVISFARGGQSATMLDDESDPLINLSGPITVLRTLYERVRSAVDHAYAAPAFAAAAGNLFAAEWFALTDRLDEQYGRLEPRRQWADPALERIA